MWNASHPYVKRVGSPTARQLCAERPAVQHPPSARLVAVPAPRGGLAWLQPQQFTAQTMQTALRAPQHRQQCEGRMLRKQMHQLQEGLLQGGSISNESCAICCAHNNASVYTRMQSLVSLALPLDELIGN